MSIGTCILLCVLSFAVGTWAGVVLIALLSANKEDDNGNER